MVMIYKKPIELLYFKGMVKLARIGKLVGMTNLPVDCLGAFKNKLSIGPGRPQGYASMGLDIYLFEYALLLCQW